MILELRVTGIAHLQQFSPAGMHVGPARFRHPAELIRAFADDTNHGLLPILFQQGKENAITALVPVVKGEEDRLFRQGFSRIYIVQDIRHEDRRIPGLLQPAQVAFHFLRQDDVLPRMIPLHLMIHQHRQQDFLFLSLHLLPEISESVQQESSGQYSAQGPQHPPRLLTCFS